MKMGGGRSAAMELTSISCKGVKAPFNLVQKQALYIIVSVSGAGDRADKTHKTPLDRVGGENPEWDHPIRLDVGDRRGVGSVLDFEVKAHGLFADSTVGRARIPLSDLDFTGVLRHGSYQVRTPNGKSNGAISFSYKIDGPHEWYPAAVNPAFSVMINNHPEYPKVDLYPPPPPALAFDYGHPQPPTPSAPTFDYGHRPPPPPSFDYSCHQLTPDAAVSSPPSAYGYGWPAQPTTLGGGEFYPPPQAPGYAVYPPPPLQAAYHPSPAAACCCHEPRDLNWYRQDGWGRGVYGYN